MVKPITTEELFKKIQGILKEKGKLPDILDYGLAIGKAVPIRTYNFELKSNLAYGGSEGIYLDLWIEYFSDNEKLTEDIGTFKTLNEDNEAMHIMAALLADFIIEEYAYVNTNLDDFNWEGANIYMLDNAGKRLGGYYSCDSMERALEKKDELLGKFPQVIVRDNATREEKTYKRNLTQ